MKFSTHPKSFLSLILNLIVSIHPATADFIPIQIRMTAASFLGYNSTESQGITYKQSKAGFDVLWNAKMDSDTSTVYPEGSAIMLNGSGKTTLGTPSGVTCTGNLTVHTGANPFYEVIKVENNRITLKIAGPHTSGNSGTTATLDDQTGVPFGCRVPLGTIFLSGTQGGTESIEWTPVQQLLPRDTDADYAGTTRSGFAVVQLNAKALPAIVPFTFEYSATVGAVTTKHVWFGRVEVSKGKKTPTPADPFSLGQYQQPTDPTALPNDPPVNTNPPSAKDFSKWIKGLFPAIPRGLNQLFAQFQADPSTLPARDSAVFIYDAGKSLATATDISAAPPAAGTLSFKLDLKSADAKLTGFKGKVPASAIANSLTGAERTSAIILLDSKIKKAIKSGKAYSVFLTAKFQPNAGGEAYVYSGKVGIKAKKKK